MTSFPMHTKYGLKLCKNVVACTKYQAYEGFKAKTFKNRVVHAVFIFSLENMV